MGKKFFNKKSVAILATVAIVVAIVLLVLPFGKGKTIEADVTSVNETLEVSNKKGSYCNAFNANTSEIERVEKLSHTLYVTYGGTTLSTEGVITGNTVTTADGLVISFSGTEGSIEATVSYMGQTASVAMCAEVDIESGNATEGIKGNSYNLPEALVEESQRNVMDPNQGYHENLFDNEGNVVGQVTRDEISGTVEAEASMAEEPTVEMVQSSEGDRIHTAPVETPEVPTVEVEEPIIPVAPVEPEATPEVEAPVVPESTPEADTPVYTPENPVAPAPEAEAAPEVAPEADPEVETPQGPQVTSDFAECIVFDAEGNFVANYFGNGTGTLEVNNPAIEELGSGLVAINGVVFAK